MNGFDFENRAWWEFLESDLQELLKESEILVKKSAKWKVKFHDYSFVVFPAAKAYEGFLKKIFLDRGFITKKEYLGKRFRIGKALNPSLDRRYRKESVYDRIVEFCGGKETANTLWNTWKNCRNVLFHFFPNESNAISYSESVEKVKMVADTMDEAFSVCRINPKEISG